MRVRLEIRIFLWELTRGCLLSGSEVLKRNGPEDGLCPLFGACKDFTYIFLLCMAAQFLLGCLREALGAICAQQTCVTLW